MKPGRYLIIVALVSLTLCAGVFPADAEPEKDRANRGSQAESDRSGRGSKNTDAQWTADPERGWVRSDERRDTHKENQPESSRQNRGKHKAQDKK
jgi:hypothetical protein